ncbi:MAG: hypothetical protein ABIQ72_00970 [Usitatibacter sp.]
MNRKSFLLAAAVIAAALPAMAQEQPRIAASPFLPSYGMPVTLDLQESSLRTFIPATRYVISGNNITVDYEYASTGAASAAMGQQPVQLGELPAGNYNVSARLHDINKPNAAPRTLLSSIAVVPPQSPGLYSIPSQPRGFAPTSVMVKSAAYFDPRTLRARLSGKVVRVDFDYASLPPGSDAPAGLTTFASVRIAQAMAPGAYTLEGWGRTNGGAYQKFFTQDMVVTQSTPVVEYYSARLDHYFFAAGADEIDLLDKGRQGDWKRTGLDFAAFARDADAAPGSAAVCRFYASGPNSHFFTGNQAECDYLKVLEEIQRAKAAQAGTSFQGWSYEGIAFYAMIPSNGQCPSYTAPVKRFYNNRAAQNDSNHRFTSDPAQMAAMDGWIDEGVVFCSVP